MEKSLPEGGDMNQGLELTEAVWRCYRQAVDVAAVPGVKDQRVLQGAMDDLQHYLLAAYKAACIYQACRRVDSMEEEKS